MGLVNGARGGVVFDHHDLEVFAAALRRGLGCQIGAVLVLVYGLNGDATVPALCFPGSQFVFFYQRLYGTYRQI